MIGVNYTFNGDRRQRCFVIDGDGELIPVECRGRKVFKPGDGHQGTTPPVLKEVNDLGVEVGDQPGLGDVVAKATKAVGIQPCGKCRKRQESLNKATPTWASKVLGKFIKPSGTDAPQ